MRVKQLHLRNLDNLPAQLEALKSIQPNWVLVFGAPSMMADTSLLSTSLAAAFPTAIRTGCSTAGEITAQGVAEDSCTIVGVHFEKTEIWEATTTLSDMQDSYAAGQRLGEQLVGPDLRAVFVLAQGVAINGSALSAGLSDCIGSTIPVSGGLAGDGTAFNQTWVLSSAGPATQRAVAIGFYGDALHYAFGSFGGWQAFGPVRKVTRCEGNLLYELDGEPALEIYKRYLGDHAKQLPASGLLFPFLMMNAEQMDSGLIRTILGIDEATNSLILAGEIDPDGYLRLMHSNPDALAIGSERAAQAASEMMGDHPVDLAILVSCVGRKLTMGDLVDEEVEVVRDMLGAQATITGFYSYGEICPMAPEEPCKLHNQTMTIAFLSESV